MSRSRASYCICKHTKSKHVDGLSNGTEAKQCRTCLCPVFTHNGGNPGTNITNKSKDFSRRNPRFEDD